MPRFYYSFEYNQRCRLEGWVEADNDLIAEQHVRDNWRDIVNKDDDDAFIVGVNLNESTIDINSVSDPFNEEQPIIDHMEQYGDDDGDPTRYDEDDPMYRVGPNEDMSWMDDKEN